MAKNKSIVRIVGTRPQLMQVPTILNEVLKTDMNHILVHTGQHYDFEMSETFFKKLKLPAPHFNLDVGSGSHAQTTGHAMIKLEKILIEIDPAGVLVDGDTNSTLAGALAAAKLNIPVFHIEAGTRDLDRNRPEEINRIMTDHLATLNFSPIKRALDNLKNEGLGSKSEFYGDVLLDCYNYFEDMIDMTILEDLQLRNVKYNLMTLHRPENTDLSQFEFFSEILKFIDSLDEITIFPVHPRTKSVVEKYKNTFGNFKRIRVIEPVDYLRMRGLLQNSETVFTDSGGLPREAVWTGKKCIMFFRQDTWHDLIENNWAGIYKGGNASLLPNLYSRLKTPNKDLTQKFFGAGMASEKIVNKISEVLA